MITSRTVYAILLAGASLLAVGARAQDAARPTQVADAAAPQDQIIVTGRRSNNDARLEQKNAPNLVNVQPAEEILKYPDFNAAESLGRVPGVSLSTDTGEGRFVNIRGVDSNLNGTTFGGVTLLNTQPGGTYFGGGGRAVELDTIPIGAIDRLVVRKTGLPDQEAEGLGGSVELSPRTASGIRKPFVDGTIGGGYQPAHGHGGIYRAELAAGTRFGPDQSLGIVLYGSYHEDGRGFDDIEPAYVDPDPADRATLPTDKIYDGVDLRRYNYNRRRFGFGGEVSYDPTPQSHFYIRAANAGYTESVNRQVLSYNGLGEDTAPDPANANGLIASGVTPSLGLRDEQETHLNFISAVGGHNEIGTIILDYQGSYTASTYHRDYDYGSTFSGSLAPFQVRYDNNSNVEFPVITPVGFNPGDPSQYSLTGFRNQTEGAHDREWAGQINVTVPFHLIGTDENIKFGGKVRFRDKRDLSRNIGYFSDANPIPNTPLTQILGPGPYNDFYDGRYAIGYSPGAQAIRNLIPRNPTLFPPSVSPAVIFNDTENIYAGYAQYQATVGKFGVLAGVRVENTDGTYRNPDPLSDDQLTLVARKNSYTDVFPTIQLRYEFSKDLIARATWSTGISRPGFNQLQAGTFVDAGGPSISVGNPGLQPITDDAFDVTAEYYLPNSGIFSLGFFDKEFNNYVLNRISRVQSDPRIPDPQGTITITGYENVKDSYLRGIEAQYVQKFSRLPAPFNGLGFTGNVTYVDSHIALRPGEFSRLPGTSELTWNVGAFYEAHGVQVRISAQTVSNSIFGVGDGPGLDVYQDDKTQVDLTSSYAFNKNVSVYFNARNLTNGALRYYEGYPNRQIQREFYDVSYEAGARFAF